jgi:hypothetical protein
MSILVLGHGEHGKDEVGLMLNRRGYTTKSSSSFCLEKVIWPAIGGAYSSPEECYGDRRNRRDEWFKLILDYNTPDKARLTKALLADYDTYIGMRSLNEFLESSYLFKKILWVDRSQHKPHDTSMEITFDPDTMEFIDNNGTLNNTEERIAQLFDLI